MFALFHLMPSCHFCFGMNRRTVKSWTYIRMYVQILVYLQKIPLRMNRLCMCILQILLHLLIVHKSNYLAFLLRFRFPTHLHL